MRMSRSGQTIWEEYVDGMIAALFGKTASLPAIVGPMATFVFQPGGVTSGNVFTTFAALYAAATLSRGPITVKVDDSLGAAHITAGGPYNFDGWTFLGTKLLSTVLNIDAGVTFSFQSLVIDDALTVTMAAAATMMTVTSGFPALYLRGQSTFQNSTATAPIRNSGGSFFVQSSYVGAFGDGVHPVLTVDVGQFAFANMYDNSGLLLNAVAGLGTFQITYDSSTFVQNQTVSTFTKVLADSATLVTYTPGTAGNWQPAPTLVNAALDQLAAPNIVQAQANTGTGTGTTTAVTGNIAKLRSGKMVVSASVSGIMTAGGTVTVSLLRDATPILALGALTFLATTSYSIPIEFIDTAPDAANHTYTVKAVASAGNLTVPANGNGIVVTEM